VIATIPQSGAADVDPALTELRVTFSKDMATNRMWSLCQISKESFPQSAGQVHYVDNRTCVMPVKLEPGKTYALWFNRAQFNAFRDTQDHPSVPYQLVFETRQ
jgi:RNA polymerase sigma-70 factor (ECF subfamily)